MKAKFFLALLLLIGSFLPLSANAASNLVSRPKRELLRRFKIEDISAANKELAEQLEIWSQISDLYNSDLHLSRERKLELSQEVRETIMECYLDGASLQSEALREKGIIEGLKQTFLDKRDQRIEINNAGNFIASGTLNTIGSVLGFSDKTPSFSGNLNQMLSGVVSTGMSSYALKQQSGGKYKSHAMPTVLAELFGRPVDARTTYPESIWRFLNGKSMEEPEKTRLQVLEERWIARGALEPHGSRREALKLDIVCGLQMTRKVVRIQDLDDQISMIEDVAAMTSRMHHHLRDLLSMVDTDVIFAHP
ncbi:MAG: hypothetical protein K2X27_18620 [Candidatus Obscuribacterales bacterium]|nr:hypothetical protein [Candidatus Obscuribacterales bacterium]